MSTKITRFRNLLILALMCLISGSVWGQETTETFANATNLSGNTAYNATEASFTGVNNIEWKFLHCQDGNKQSTKYIIDGITPILRHPNAYMKADKIEGGISSFSLKYKRAYTGTKPSRIVEVYINDILVGSGEECKDDNTERTLIVNDLNISGDFSVKIKLRGSGTTNAQTCIDDFKWTSNVPTIVAAPTISPESCEFAESQEVTITQNEGADIYYTTDGNKPTSGSLKYTAPFTINATTTVRAIAIKNGVESDEAEARIYTKQAPANKVNTPIFDEASGDFEIEKLIILSCSTEGAKIYYNINEESNPTSASTLYNADEGITITETSTIKTIAIKEGLDDSEIATATYTKVLATPEFKYSSDKASANLGETFTAPTLSYNGNSDLSGLTISYTSSDTNVATINAEGVVALGTAGKTTITASVSATNDYEAAEATYILNVIDPNARFVLAINYENQWYAISQKVDGKAEAKNIEINNDKKVISDVTGLLWTIEEDKYLKAENETFLAYKGSGTDINLIETAYEWILQKQNDGSYYIKATTGSNRYLAYGTAANQKKFGGYLNADGYILSIYILSAAAPEEPKSTIDEATGAMTLTGAWTAEGLSTIDLSNVTSIDMTGIEIPANATLNANITPNCLIYVKSGATIPTNWKNVIEGATAETITIEDGYAFHNTTETLAEGISYKRSCYTDGGWETICVPFDVVSITDESGNAITDYTLQAYSQNNGTVVDFTDQSAIMANTPYIIRFAKVEGQEKSTYILKSEEGAALLPVTVEPKTEKGDYAFKGSYKEINGTDKYLLNAAGSKFGTGSDIARIIPFRAYMESTSANPSSVKELSVENGGGTTNLNSISEDGLVIYSTENGIEIHSDKAQSINLYSIDGRILRNISVQEGVKTINDLAKGIYLINNQKIIVR